MAVIYEAEIFAIIGESFLTQRRKGAKIRQEVICFMSNLLPELFGISRPSLTFFASSRLCVKKKIAAHRTILFSLTPW